MIAPLVSLSYRQARAASSHDDNVPTTTSATMTRFTDLPVEVATAILSQVTPHDLLAVSLASRGMRSYVLHNTQLHRLVYCRYFVRFPPGQACAGTHQLTVCRI